MTTVTKEFSFDMAHMLCGHPGLCKNLHGHTYKLLVTAAANGELTNGMVCDFSTLKDVVKERIVNALDHAVMINTNTTDTFELALWDLCKAHGKKHYLVGARPTAENMCHDFYKELNTSLTEIGASFRVTEVKLYETPTSYAIYNEEKGGCSCVES